MKTIVSVQEISEFEIKPRESVAEWRALVAAEIAARWSDRADWIKVDCPACGGRIRCIAEPPLHTAAAS